MKAGTKVILTSALIIGAVIGGHLLWRKWLKKRITHQSFQKETEGNSIVTIPDTSFKKYDVIIVYGGLTYATPAWMYHQVHSSVPSILYGNIVIFVPWSASTSYVNSLVHKYTEGKDVGAMSMIGFSKGGEPVVDRQSDREWRFIGLIDPAIGWGAEKKNWGKETVFVYGSAPMMEIYESNGRRYSKLAEAVKKGGGTAKNSVSTHSNSPKEFFEQYKFRINHGTQR